MSRYLDSFTILDDGPKRETGAGLRDHPFHFDDTVSGPFSVALANARFIEKVNRVSYPEGIISTKIELNANAKDGKFRYDRDFLIQFMSVCKGKPPRFPDLGPLGLEPADQSQHDSYRGGSGRRTSSDMHSVALNLRTLVALDFGDLDDSSDLSMAQHNLTTSFSHSRPGTVVPVHSNPTPTFSPRAKTTRNEESPVFIYRKVKYLLNKLTPNNVDFIAGEIITQANKSYTQTDGCSLKEFTRIILDKAIDDSTWSAHYARLCRKIMDHISPQLQDENIKDSDGMPIAGGRLFRMNLLKCCQEDFACGWVCNGDAIVATKAKDDAISSPVPTGDKETNASVPNSSDERDAFTKAKRQGMSLIKLAGELFKLQMFPERAMHMCIKRLLQNIESPEEEEIVSVCGLLTSVGELLDTTRGSSDMDVYFMRMHKLVHNARVNSRMQYLLLEVIELRDRAWMPHQAAASRSFERLLENTNEDDTSSFDKRMAAGHRGGFIPGYRGGYLGHRGGFRGGFRGGDRGGFRGAFRGDRRDSLRGSSMQGPPAQASDLPQFGKINLSATSTSMTLGINSVFNKRDIANHEPGSMSPSSSTAAFLLVSQGSKTTVEWVPSASAMITTGMSEAVAKENIDEFIQEFFSVRNINGAQDYFGYLPKRYRPLLVEKLVTRAIESKRSDVQLVADLFEHVHTKDMCTLDAFEQGFFLVAETLYDIAVDAPGALEYMNLLLQGSGLAADETRRARITKKWIDTTQLMESTKSDAEDSLALVDRKVKSLLSKLTLQNFEDVSGQIITHANKSENQSDGRTLIQVIRLVFEKATDDAAWSEMYARLCRKIMEQISPKVQDESIKNTEGKPIAGGQLFRKYLLNRCQEDFERGWASKKAAAAAAAAKAKDDDAVTAGNADKKIGDGETKLYSEEYYASEKAKRQGLGLVKFIGELFKVQMLTERIMHECVKKLLNDVDNPEEEEIESLCTLLTTVGKLLDTARGGPYMDIYFTRMRELTKNPKVNSRMQYMLLELAELRDRKWIPRNAVAAPTTISQVHADAAKKSLRAQIERTMSMSRGGSRRGNDRGGGKGSDRWGVAGGSAAPRPQPRAGDLSQFGKINKPTANAPMTFGPSSVFNKKDTTKRESASLSRASNAFSLLSQGSDAAAEPPAPTVSAMNSRAPSRKASVDLGPGGAPEISGQRRKLNLLPRSKPAEDGSRPASPDAVAFPSTEDKETEEPEEAGMSETEAKKKIDEDIKEFFAVRDIDEAEDYFVKLPSQHRHLLVDKLVTRAIESKQSDAQLVSDLFERAHSKDLCTPDAFEQGFLPVAEMLDDIAIDAPKAFDLMAIMLKGSGVTADEARRGRITEKSMDADKLIAMLT